MFYGSNARTFRFAKKLRNNMTDAEQILWNRLSNKQLGCRFKRQHPICNFIADFYCHKAKLVIEVDGAIHERADRIIRDNDRTEKIQESSGCLILRFTNNEVKHDIENVILTIKRALARATSPSGEAGGANQRTQ